MIDLSWVQVAAYKPAWPVTLIAAAVVLLIAAGSWVYGRSTLGARSGLLMASRLMAIGGLAWILFGPSVREPGPASDRPVPLNLLVDTSASMAERDVNRDGQPVTRLEAIQRVWLTPEALERLEPFAAVSLAAFDTDLRPIGVAQAQRLRPGGEQTRLYDAVGQARGESADAVTVVFSDGHDTGGGSAVLPTDGDGRVFTVPVGQSVSVPDLAIQAWADAAGVTDGQAVTLHAAVHQRGFAGQRVTVELISEDGLVESRGIQLGQAPTQTVSFRVTPTRRPGEPVSYHEYRLRVTATQTTAAERDTSNNARPVFVQVARDKLRVALFEAQPHWDSRNLARVLEADPGVALTAVYQVGPERTLARLDENAMGVSGRLDQATLNRFDVVVLGKGVERFFPGPDASMLVDYVEQRGGALVFARGQPWIEQTDTEAARLLDRISPVAWGRAMRESLLLELTPQGMNHPVFEGIGEAGPRVTTLPGMIAATTIDREKAASIVYMRQTDGDPPDAGSPMASVASMRVGRGRVFAVLGDGLWRWPLTGEAGGQALETFWQRAVHWLAAGGEFLPGQDVALTLSRQTVEPGESVVATVSTRYFPTTGFEPRLRVIRPDGRVTDAPATTEPQRPGVWHATLSADVEGVYRVECLVDADAAEPVQARLAVYSRSTERLDPAARPEVLKQIADETGGVCLTWQDPEPLIQALRDTRTARETGAVYRDDFARWPVFVLIVGSLGFEWVMRRRSGMV